MTQRKSKVLTPVLCLTFVLIHIVSSAQEAKLAPATRKQIEATVAKFMAVNNVPGISVAVVKDGEYVTLLLQSGNEKASDEPVTADE